MANHQTPDVTRPQLGYNANAGQSKGRFTQAEPREKRVRQSICAACGKTVRPGGGIVLAYGAGGRVCKKCYATQQGAKDECVS